MNKYGMYVKFTAIQGKSDELLQILLNAAEAMKILDECEIYIVNKSKSEPEVIWVTEVWTNVEAHKRSLLLEESKAMIEQAQTLIAGIGATEILPIGGKGISDN
ncbi:antibiotic biosynthesis monooxygenase [Neobacillus cucumis]|uniref:putative quinol monooxygenase n=1 Tax=Neobacillus cucumis TaxID=1740721 RepID=UPI0018DF24DB|nr:antibiotic biosynthesis monooxygenase [Neobacillus cucumis]MBI0579258.1 antibiotic biosynthesis monooxygenase [Neobacillus cucumis]